MAWQHPPAIGCRFSFLHLPCGRCGHSVCLADAQLVLFGGYDGRKWLNDLHLFNTHSLVWTQPVSQGQPPGPRQYHTAATVQNSMYVFGGFNGLVWLRDLALLDLERMTWLSVLATGAAPSAREGHAMVAVHSNLWVFGGWNGSPLGELFRFDTLTKHWTQLLIATPQLCGHSMTLVKDQLFVFGGFDQGHGVATQLRSCD